MRLFGSESPMNAGSPSLYYGDPVYVLTQRAGHWQKAWPAVGHGPILVLSAKGIE
ncbi:hypothetical protein GCM10023339_81840 [Alloalcanivorax gelatiniphagus]